MVVKYWLVEDPGLREGVGGLLRARSGNTHGIGLSLFWGFQEDKILKSIRLYNSRLFCGLHSQPWLLASWALILCKGSSFKQLQTKSMPSEEIRFGRTLKSCMIYSPTSSSSILFSSVS
jgi:hypothetical protein